MPVTARAKTSNDAIRASWLERVVYDYRVDVQNGKLTNLRGVQDVSDPQTAAFQAFQRAQQPNTAAIRGTSAGLACGRPLVPRTGDGRKRTGGRPPPVAAPGT